MAMHVKKDDNVMVIAGNDKGSTGKVLSVDPKKNMVLIQGINVVKRHVRPTRQNPSGGVLEKELPVHISNVLPLNPKTNKPTRVKFVTDGGKKKRVSVQDGSAI